MLLELLNSDMQRSKAVIVYQVDIHPVGREFRSQSLSLFDILLKVSKENVSYIRPISVKCIGVCAMILNKVRG